MADNTAQGGADTLRTWDRAGVKTGVSALDVAQSGASELLGLGSPLTVPVPSSGLTTATTAYTAGDQLGAELTFTVGRASGRGVVITSAFLIDKSKVTGPVDLWLFDRASTPAGDNAANSWADADMANCIGRIKFDTPQASALNSLALPLYGLPIVADGNASADIKGVLVTRSAHTFFGAATDLVVVLGVEPG